MKLGWKAALGVLVTVLLLTWALRDVAFSEVWVHLREGDPLLLGAAVFVATFGFLIRALRWKILLHTVRPDTSLRSRFSAVSIGFMANNVLPARVGEFARAYALSRVEPVSASAAFGTLVVERILDALVLLGLIVGATLSPGFPQADVFGSGPLGTALTGVGLLLAILVPGLVVLLFWPRPCVRLAGRLAARLPRDLARPAVDALEALLGSLEILRRPRLLALAAVWSVGFWVFHGLSFWLGMAAFDIHLGLGAAFFTEGVVGFGVALPSAPGFFGTFHASANWALTDVYGVEPARSLAFAFGYHLGGWIPITAIGLWYAWRMGLSLSDVGRSEERVEEAVEAEHPEAIAALAGEPPRDSGPAVVDSSENYAAQIDAPCKINLYLRVLGLHEGGPYHEIETLFLAVDLQDHLAIEPGGKDVRLTVEGADVGPPEENLVTRAARAFVAETGIDPGLRIRLRKRIPAGAGLGGGSSDAAATLRGLNALFGEPLDGEALRSVGRSLGADVSFFLGGSAFALGRGRGDDLVHLAPLPTRTALLGLPDIHVSTPWAYGALSGRRAVAGAAVDAAPRLTGRDLDWSELEGLATNDFETVVLDEHPAIAGARRALVGTGARLVLMSGSGSAVAAIYDEPEAASAALDDVTRTLPTVRFLLARTLGTLPEPTVFRRAPGARGLREGVGGE